MKENRRTVERERVRERERDERERERERDERERDERERERDFQFFFQFFFSRHIDILFLVSVCEWYHIFTFTLESGEREFRSFDVRKR